AIAASSVVMEDLHSDRFRHRVPSGRKTGMPENDYCGIRTGRSVSQNATYRPQGVRAATLRHKTEGHEWFSDSAGNALDDRTRLRLANIRLHTQEEGAGEVLLQERSPRVRRRPSILPIATEALQNGTCRRQSSFEWLSCPFPLCRASRS